MITPSAAPVPMPALAPVLSDDDLGARVGPAEFVVVLGKEEDARDEVIVTDGYP